MKPQPSWMGEGGRSSNHGRGPDLMACLVGLRSHSQLHWGCCSTRTGPKYVGSSVCTESLRMYVGYTNSFSIRFLSIPTILYISYLLKYISYLQQLTIRIQLADDFFLGNPQPADGALHPFFVAKCPLSSPQKSPASAAKPISACLYNTLTLMLYNLINRPNLMGAHPICGQFFGSW